MYFYHRLAPCFPCMHIIPHFMPCRYLTHVAKISSCCTASSAWSQDGDWREKRWRSDIVYFMIDLLIRVFILILWSLPRFPKNILVWGRTQHLVTTNDEHGTSRKSTPDATVSDSRLHQTGFIDSFLLKKLCFRPGGRQPRSISSQLPTFGRRLRSTHTGLSRRDLSRRWRNGDEVPRWIRFVSSSWRSLSFRHFSATANVW